MGNRKPFSGNSNITPQVVNRVKMQGQTRVRKRMFMNLEQSLKAVKLKENDKVRQKCLQFNLRKGGKGGNMLQNRDKNQIYCTEFPSSLKYNPMVVLFMSINVVQVIPSLKKKAIDRLLFTILMLSYYNLTFQWPSNCMVIVSLHLL